MVALRPLGMDIQQDCAASDFVNAGLRLPRNRKHIHIGVDISSGPSLQLNSTLPPSSQHYLSLVSHVNKLRSVAIESVQGTCHPAPKHLGRSLAEV
jgi:hypothetical protein